MIMAGNAPAPNAAAKTPPVKKPMAAWYDPGLLAGTGVRTVISSLFGTFADKREAIAAANAIQPTPADGEFNYAAKHPGGDFWFDYLADSGDGWNPTFAMARLVAEDLSLGETLKRGRLLVCGGDQVYPTASREEYQDRFIGPFDHAYDRGGGRPLWPDDPDHRPHLYAIPGNHDWYDGLSAFFGLFCRRRVVREASDLGIPRDGKVIGGRQTQQTRSYFAIELPNGWWLWGTDSQLEGYIDQPQIDYFQHAAAYWMKPGSKLILCVADPSWVYVDPKNPSKRFDSFSYLERLASAARMPKNRPDRADGWPEADRPMGHELKAVLTGDSHHYCRYVEHDEDPETPARHYIVCGGGGAFLHPTHHLRDVAFDYRFAKPGSTEAPTKRCFQIAGESGREAMFPDKAASKGLSWGNLKFAWLNKSFVLLLFFIYGFFNWILDFNAGLSGRGSLADALRGEPLGWGQGLLRGVCTYWDLVATSPWSALLVLISGFAYTRFADSPHSPGRRWLMGGLHAIAQAAAVTLTTVAVMLLTKDLIPDEPWDAIASTLLATAASAIVSAIVFGLYLLVCIRWLRRHANEGFSSMAIEGYKSFLRIRIGADGALTIFPVGLKDVPKNDDEAPLEPELIEPPIRIV
jgi:hypothetical protein